MELSTTKCTYIRLIRDKLESRVRPYRQTNKDKITSIYYYNNSSINHKNVLFFILQQWA